MRIGASTELKKIMSDDDLAEIIDVNKESLGAARPLAELLDDLKHFENYVGAENSHLIISALKSNSFFYKNIGAAWTIHYMRNNADEFTNATLIFEEAVNGGERYIDLVKKVGNRKTLYEFKSVQTIPPGRFIEQFTADLANSDVTDLGQLRWVFEQSKIAGQDLKTALLNELKSTKGREGLMGVGATKAKQLFPLDELMDDNNFVERIISNMSKDEYFNLIFK